VRDKLEQASSYALVIMKQLTQKLKDGTMQVQDVPEPMLGPGMVLGHPGLLQRQHLKLTLRLRFIYGMNVKPENDGNHTLNILRL